MKVSMIAAISNNHVLGKDNDMVWNLPDDMKFFADTTKGHHVIMGRKNYESLPHKWRPLPNRVNIVLTRQSDYQAPGCVVMDDFMDAVQYAQDQGEEELFLIGGEAIYKMGLAQTDTIYLSEIDAEFDGDAFFPKFDKSQWTEISRIPHPIDEKHQFAFDFVLYERIPLQN